MDVYGRKGKLDRRRKDGMERNELMELDERGGEELTDGSRWKKIESELMKERSDLKEGKE
jgi:hypothetical protein